MIVVVIPSRGRPERARDAVQAARETAVLADTRIIVAIDTDDPTYRDYGRLIFDGFHREVQVEILGGPATGDLVRATNTVSTNVAAEYPDAIIGNLGDDHMARTVGWDLAILNALERPGIAYGNDLLQGEKLPTAPFISASIVNALGWYAQPSLRHMFIDDVWKAIGLALGRLVYLPDVVIEHMHPGAGKAELDDGYVRADASTETDRHAYSDWLAGSMAADVARVREALAVAA